MIVATTFAALRSARQAYRRVERLGRGWKSRAERYLAASEARRAEEARREAREAMYAEQAA